MDQPAEEGDRQDDKQKDDHMGSIASHGLKIAIFPAMDKGGRGGVDKGGPAFAKAMAGERWLDAWF